MNRRVTVVLLAVSLVLVIAGWTIDPGSGFGGWIAVGLALTFAGLLRHLTRPARLELARFRYPGGDL